MNKAPFRVSTLTGDTTHGIQRVSSPLGGAWLGLEIGSLSTFFSGERPALGNIRIEQAHHWEPSAHQGRELIYDVRYPDARLHLQEVELEQARQLSVRALGDSLLMDAVLRFVFPLSEVRAVVLNNRPIPWKRQNKYHQEAAAIAKIQLKDGTWRTFVPLRDGELPEGLELLTYVRDEPDAWVLHIRVRANQPTHFQIRGCSRWYNKPLPAWAQRLLNRMLLLQRTTLYIRERVSQRIPFQTNGAVYLPRGTSFRFGVRWF